MGSDPGRGADLVMVKQSSFSLAASFFSVIYDAISLDESVCVCLSSGNGLARGLERERILRHHFCK